MVWDEHTSNGLTDEFLGFIGCDVPDAVCGQGFGGNAWAVHTSTSCFLASRCFFRRLFEQSRQKDPNPVPVLRSLRNCSKGLTVSQSPQYLNPTSVFSK
jgi:hypothetical protein